MQNSPSATPERPATLKDVADLSGVATSTVSRALSTPSRVNAATRERIERAAEKLGYIGTSQARKLSMGAIANVQGKSIAVLVADVSNPFYFDIIRGTQQQARAAGYSQLLIDTEESSELEQSMLRGLRGSFDGAVIAASRLTDRELTEISAAIPIVAINRQTAGVPSVFIDSPFGIDQAVEHLISLGHREVVYAAGPETSWSNEGRWRSFVRAMKRHGLTARRLGPFSPKLVGGAAAADAVINSGATACVAFNDLLAIGMLSRLRDRGVRVPDDVSIVGCDDIFGADFCNPPLTTLTAPIEQAGRVAVSMLLANLSQEPQQTPRHAVVLPTHLTVRDSTGPAPSRKKAQ
ncbi:LacI family DNA-binding transcriptional regulator [Salinibacterium sp. NK8237]|uniref:LacI family DNA-binding transcriptional regulator n=1 Tax=Salinibacterium sp. NK8237 TaxID=2792038 RepID=UPI0018CD5ED5|nr:LacI family DNA-binding transcriptional regulator [Salinibacterium sp. NK8237]MBH0131154.1 LacI family DNA-binding transcriptional regulator [Salinibacterium sp. NK8237]